MSLRCPYCHAESSVVGNAPPKPVGSRTPYAKRRYRVCDNGHRFRSIEVLAGSVEGHKR